MEKENEQEEDEEETGLKKKTVDGGVSGSGQGK